jgi:hypothetical protein
MPNSEFQITRPEPGGKDLPRRNYGRNYDGLGDADDAASAVR